MTPVFLLRSTRKKLSGVDHEFLMRVLSKFGFGECFVAGLAYFIITSFPA